MLPLEITVAEAHERLARDNVTLIDCREPEEAAICAIDGARLIPLGELPDRLDEFAGARDRRLVVYCHHGMRSFRAAAWLRQQGFSTAQSLAGGIDAWAAEVEPGMARY